jgi:8-oxo-dGTP pyrophosphatase MutT (NUDIX family)
MICARRWLRMTENRRTSTIEAKAICVFRDGDRILACEYYDPTKRQRFYRPPGGRIEFGEPSVAALRREIREELGSEIENPRLLGVLESLFVSNGRQGHEVMFVYDATLVKRELYGAARLTTQESNGEAVDAVWLDLNAIGPESPPLYPLGLVELLNH